MPYKFINYVHKDSKKFISKKGCLFSSNGVVLYRFCDKELKGISYTIPKSVGIICIKAFFGADIKKVIFNENVDLISQEAFKNSAVETVVMDNVKEISPNCFENCVNLKEVVFDDEGVRIQPCVTCSISFPLTSASFSTPKVRSLHVAFLIISS